jgi:redox-sensing transcriptional repressor
VADVVVAAGIKAILNFSPGGVDVPAGVKVKSVDLTVSLESLSYYLAQGDGHED